MGSDQPAAPGHNGAVPDVSEEVVDGLPVLASDTTIARVRPAALPARQVAALAASGFVAGVATVAVVTRRRHRVIARRRARARKSALGEIVASNSFLVDVHLIRRD